MLLKIALASLVAAVDIPDARITENQSMPEQRSFFPILLWMP